MSCSWRNHRFIKFSKFQNPADLPSPKKCLLWAMFPKNRWPILQQKSTIWIMDTWETNGFYMVCKSWKGWNMPHFVDDWPLQEMVMFQFANCAMTRGRAPIFLGFPLGIAITSLYQSLFHHMFPVFFPLRWWKQMENSRLDLLCWEGMHLLYQPQLISAAQLCKKAEGNPWKTLGPLFENIPSGYD